MHKNEKKKHKMIQAGCKEGNEERTRMSTDSVNQEVQISNRNSMFSVDMDMVRTVIVLRVDCEDAWCSRRAHDIIICKE
jgi:hypothetical protein